jgi:PAS domain S-box-containing protein
MAEEMAYHALLFEHISDAIVAVDADMIVRDWNRAAERIYGYRAGEVLGRSLPEVARTQTPPTEDASMLADLYAGGFWLGEVTHLHKDGHPIPMYSSVSVVRDADGLITGYVAVNRDMTEQRRAQQAIEDERALLAQRVEERTLELRAANRQLVHAAKAKDEFLASMSHELRTPLNAVLVLSEIIDTEAAGPVTAQQRKYLKNIQESGQHLLGLINDVLDLSKIEAGMLSVDCGPVAVTDLCTASIGLIAGQAQAKQITYSTSVDSEVRLIQADGRRTKQILVNLLSNAVKFTPAQGQVGLMVAGDRTAELVRFTVWDTGIGIAPEQMVQLFEPFVQLDSSLTRRYEGSGLGLPLAIRLARLQGGNIEVESEVGKGSHFTLSLPWTPLTAANAVAAGPKTAERRGNDAATTGSVLLVDDTPTFLHAARDYLRLRGIDVATATSGSEALALSRARRPDLILMDIQMPELDGLATTHLLRQDPELSAVPVVALTALAMPGDYERCLEAGMVDYFTKPISLQRLYDVVADYMPRLPTAG